MLTFKEVSSLKGQLVEAGELNPVRKHFLGNLSGGGGTAFARSTGQTEFHRELLKIHGPQGIGITVCLVLPNRLAISFVISSLRTQGSLLKIFPFHKGNNPYRTKEVRRL